MTDARIRIPGFTCSRRRKAGNEKKGEVFQVVGVSTEASSGARRTCQPS
jgi:hypothetical protein